MNRVRIAVMAAALIVTPGSYAMADWWSNWGGGHGGGHGGGGSHGAPLPVAGAGLPLLAAAGIYYVIRNRRRD